MQYLISFLITLAVIIIYVQVPLRVFGKGKSKIYIREHRLTFLVYFVLRLLVTFTMIRSIYQENYYNAFLCLVTLMLFAAPMFIENKLLIEFPTVFEITILIFIFSAEILGEIESYYTLHQGWDTALHTLNGFLCAAVGFSLFDMLNRELSSKISLSPFYLALVAFCFSMTIGVLWEFAEFAADRILLLDAQKDFTVTSFGTVYFDPDGLNQVLQIKDITSTLISTADGSVYRIDGGYLDIGIIDTMKDLLVNLIGAAVYSISGYFLKKNEHGINFAEKFVIRVLHKNDENRS